jgi:hypothetical protein
VPAALPDFNERVMMVSIVGRYERRSALRTFADDHRITPRLFDNCIAT